MLVEVELLYFVTEVLLWLIKAVWQIADISKDECVKQCLVF